MTVGALLKHVFQFNNLGVWMDYSLKPRDLAADARQLLATLNAPSRLITHLVLVHDAAAEILEAIQTRWPALKIDADIFLFGAAIHDIGKILHPNELTSSGNRHECDGPGLLQQYGVTLERSRFALTHGIWHQEARLELEDLLVALADTVWKGSRIPDLESKVARRISTMLLLEEWEVFLSLDDIVSIVANRGDERLAWQRMASLNNPS